MWLAALSSTACVGGGDGDGTIVPLVVISGTVSGTVTVEGTGLVGVTIRLVGAASQSATTGPGGTYSFSNVPAGTYGVQVSGGPADVTFATTSRVVTISASGQVVTADFSGNYIRTSSIRGSITSGTGAGIVATVSLTGVESRLGGSDTSGMFEFTDLRAGNYTATISDFGTADFTLTSRDVSVAVGQSANVAFVGTVEEVTTSATVTISSITVTGTAGLTVVLTAVVGPIDVNLTIDEGTESITEAAVLLDGVVVGTQSFSTGAPAEDGPGGAIRTATIQINTAAFAADGTPTHTNGPKVVSAQVTTTNGAGGTSTATAASSVNLTFANTNTFAATVEATNTAVGGNGLGYYGGSLTTTLVPVIYDGLTVREVTTTFSNAGAGPVAVVTDPSGPSFGTLYSLLGYQTPAAALGTETITITAARYIDGTAFDPTGAILPLAVSGATGMSIDNVAPPAIAFVLTDQASGATSPMCCSNNWVNDSYALGTDAFEAAAVDNVDGVGGVEVTYHMGLLTESLLSIASRPAITTVGEAGLAVTTLNTVYSPVAVVTDALGSQRINGLAASADNPSISTVGLDNDPPTGEDVTGWRTRPSTTSPRARRVRPSRSQALRIGRASPPHRFGPR